METIADGMRVRSSVWEHDRNLANMLQKSQERGSKLKSYKSAVKSADLSFFGNLSTGNEHRSFKYLLYATWSHLRTKRNCLGDNKYLLLNSSIEKFAEDE